MSTDVSIIVADHTVSSANPLPVALTGAHDVTLTGPVTVSNEVEVKNDTGNRIPITGIIGSGEVTALLSAVTGTGAGSSSQPLAKSRTFQAVGSTTSGSGSATIVVQVSNDNTNWVNLATITLSLTTSASTDGFASDAPWAYVRGNVTAISGTGAAVTLKMGI